VSADGTHVITGSDDQTARLWDASSGRVLHELAGHADRVRGVGFSPDGRQAVTFGLHGPVYLWDVATGTRLRDFGSHQMNLAVFSPDGLTLATGSEGETLLWDVASGKKLLEFKGHEMPASTLTFSPDGSRLLSACRGRDVKLWDARTGTELISYVGHTDRVYAAVFNPDASRVLTGGTDGTIRLWETTTGAPLGSTRLGFTVMTTAFYPDGRHFLGATTCWDLLKPGDIPPPWFGGFLAELGGQRFGPDGRLQKVSSPGQWSDALRAIAAQPGDDDFLRLLRWRLKPASERNTPALTAEH
jgi:WD40 repeat protein